MIRFFLVILVKGYQQFISPFLRPACRFYPSCSHYCLLSLEQHGVIIGLKKSFIRICKCHPYHPGGVDFP